MTLRIGLVAAIAALGLGGPALAGPHEDANAADRRGDYVAEYAIVKPNAAAGLPWAENNLGNLYSQGHGIPQDFAKAMYWYRKAADQGDRGAQANLGLAYDLGRGVPKDGAVAAAWYRKAGDQGDDDARMDLKILCVLPGASAVPAADCAQVVIWTRADADKGDVQAEQDLAQMYDTGMLGLRQDPAAATALFRKAAEAGDARAQSSLGMRYQMGDGVERDHAQAFAWYSKAAAQGDTLAELNVAQDYETGDGVAKDDAQAFHWNRELADQGFADAQRKVGAAYAFGKGVGQDYAQAYMWLEIARSSPGRSNSETEDAQAIALDGVASHLTPAQAAEAKRLAAAWQADSEKRRMAGFAAKGTPK